MWVTIEKAGGIAKGTKVDMRASDAFKGDKGVYEASDGSPVFVRRLSTDEMVAMTLEGSEIATDSRVLTPVKYDQRGQRHQPFSDAAARMREEAMADFPLKNARSMSWLLEYVIGHGITFDGRQTKWATEQQVSPDSVAYVVTTCWDTRSSWAARTTSSTW